MPETVYTRRYRAGEEIFAMGERGRNAYIIQSGKVEVWIPTKGQRMVVAELGEGDIFGEMSMIDDAPRSATVTAIEDTELVVIQHSRIVKPLKTADPLMNLLLRVLLARFRDAQRQLADLRTGDDGPDPSLEEIRALALERIRIERDMREGMEANEFELHYQPIVALEGGHIVGFEALMRWKRDGAYRSPGQFIPVAEDTGQIVELGRMALEVGLRDQTRFAEAFAKHLPDLPAPFMSINVSGLQFSQTDEIDMLAAIIGKSGVVPGCIKLEMTESLLVDDPDLAADALNRIKGLGVSIAIDDFGTGYSSLSYLHQFPFDTLKIDRAFVNNMNKSANSERIVTSIAQLAHSLDMRIVAEGIEEREQIDDLKGLGCQFGQGFYMAKPMPASEVLELIASKPHWD